MSETLRTTAKRYWIPITAAATPVAAVLVGMAFAAFGVGGEVYRTAAESTITPNYQSPLTWLLAIALSVFCTGLVLHMLAGRWGGDNA